MYIKKIELSVLLALIFTITLSCLDFEFTSNNIRKSVFRLHILANSDSEYDQNLKIKVRNRLLKDGFELFENSENLSQTILIANNNLKKFEKSAKDELLKNGCSQNVSAKVEKTDFTVRTYGNTSLPAGQYYALQIKIGKAKGHNWWCVMYPSLCLPASTQKIDDVLDKNDAEIVKNKDKYIVKFKVCEWFEDIKSLFS